MIPDKHGKFEGGGTWFLKPFKSAKKKDVFFHNYSASCANAELGCKNIRPPGSGS